MTQEEKSQLIHRRFYANAYIETWTDWRGEKHEDFRLGYLYENEEDVPNYNEIPYARAKHLGVVKIEI